MGGIQDKLNASYSAQINVVNPQLITVECFCFPFVYAPVKKGSEIGTAVIKYKEKEICSVPITAEEDVEYYVKQE